MILSPKIKATFSAVLILLAVVGAALADIWVDYQDTTEHHEEMVSDLTKVIESQIRTTINQTETFIDEISEMVVRAGGGKPISEERFLTILRGICKGTGGCDSISITDDQGKVLANSTFSGLQNLDVSDRVYFKASKQKRSIFVGPAIVTRLPGNAIQFVISKGVYNPNGTFLGVIIIGMNIDHFTSFYQLMGFSLSPTITVFKTNGDIVARNPDMHNFVGKNYATAPLFTEKITKASSGVYRSTSVLDGLPRIAGYRIVPEFDLVIFAGIDIDVAYKSWSDRTLRIASIVSFALIVIAIALFSCFRAMRQQYSLEIKNVELNRLSNIDGLTGLANRRCFDETLKRDWNHFTRNASPLSLLLIDVDQFKRYNDHYGHQQGDECLRQVAHALQMALHREIDLVARYGGEEFVAILQCDIKGAETVARRMQLTIASLGLEHAQSIVCPKVTISIGIAEAHVGYMPDQKALIEAADKALYLAKENGRNRIENGHYHRKLTLVSTS